MALTFGLPDQEITEKTLKKRKKIVVGTNSLTEAQFPAYSNHCQLWFRLGRYYSEYDFYFVNPSRMSIDRMRNMAVKVALEQEADYLLFLDDDVLVPFDGLQKLISACESEKAGAAGGKAVIRGYPFDWMVFSQILPKDNGDLDPSSLKTFKELPTEGILEVGALGFCFTLIRVDVFRNMRPPYFVTGPNHTEDIWFFVKAREANLDFKAVCDCSVDCGHILWPEVMNSKNRDYYKEYYEKLFPEQIKSTRSIHEPLKFAIDREVGYLSLVKESLSAKA
jgi:hypothetical protein